MGKPRKSKTVREGVFFRPGSQNLQIRYTDEYGKQQRESARTNNKTVAEALYQRRSQDVLARKSPVAAEILGQLTAKQMPFLEFLEKDYFKSIEDTPSESIIKYTLKAFCRAILPIAGSGRTYGELLVKDIKVSHLIDYQNSQKVEDKIVNDGSKLSKNQRLSDDGRYLLRITRASNATKNRHRAWILAALSYATSKCLYSKAVLADIKEDNNYKKLPEVSSVRRAYSKKSLHKILDAAEKRSRHLYQIIWFAIATGFRSGRIYSLLWDNINWAANEIQISPKNDGSKINHVIPISEPIKVILKAREKEKIEGCPYVFYNPKTKTRWTNNHKCWRHILEDAEIRDRTDIQSLKKREKDNIKRVANGLEPLPLARKKSTGMEAVFYSLRHSFGSHLADSNIPVITCMKLLGHSSLEMTERYLKELRGLQEYIEPLNGLSNLLNHKQDNSADDYMADLEGREEYVVYTDSEDEAFG